MNITITGATGFIGQPLCKQFLYLGHSVTALSRDAKRASQTLGPEVRSLAWGTGAGDAWKQAVAEADVVVHLAGESVGAQRWTPEFKEKIRASRIETTRALVDALGESATKPGALISASAVGFYGDRKDEKITEQSPPGTGFFPEGCQAWEAEAQKAEDFGIRVARMRVGIVLGAGGALDKILNPLPIPISPWKLGLGGPMGSGRQWMPWIHLDDTVGLFSWAATHPQVRGPINVTAPTPVTNADFARALGRVLRRPAYFPVPAFALRALVGEFANVLLTGQRVLPEAAQRLGYTFRYPHLETALRALIPQ